MYAAPHPAIFQHVDAMASVSSNVVQKIVDNCNRINSKYLEVQNVLAQLRKQPKQENIDIFYSKFQGLKEAVNSLEIPKTVKQKRHLEEATSTAASKRHRRPSGIITLQELEKSLEPEDISTPSVQELQKQKSDSQKLVLLFQWEQSAKRSIVRVSFHSGYIIDKLLLSQDLHLKDILKQTGIPLYTLKRNRQLFQQLGMFRTILYATVPISRLQNSITAIKKRT